MAQFRHNHPWDPGYTLPKNVMAEPPGRGVIRSKGLRRKTVDSAVPYITDYAVPKYIKNEPASQPGVYWAHDSRRKTIPNLIPEYLGDYPGDDSMAQYQSYLREGAPLELTLPAEVYAMGGLGAADGQKVMPKNDAIRKYGVELAKLIINEVKTASPSDRDLIFQGVLEELEPGVYERALVRIEQYLDEGKSQKEAVIAGLASSFSEGLAKELILAGETGQIGRQSLLGLGCYGPRPLDGFWSSVGKVVSAPVKGVVKVTKKATSAIGSVIGSGAKFIAKGGKIFAGTTLALAKLGFKVPVKAAKTAVSIGGKILKGAGNLACKIVGSTTGKIAAAGAASAYGAPPAVGAAGATVASSACKGGVGQQQQIQPAPQSPITAVIQKTPTWVPIVAVGGAAALLLYYVTTK